jgi:hypothetical protein
MPYSATDGQYYVPAFFTRVVWKIHNNIFVVIIFVSALLIFPIHGAKCKLTPLGINIYGTKVRSTLIRINVEAYISKQKHLQRRDTKHYYCIRA